MFQGHDLDGGVHAGGRDRRRATAATTHGEAERRRTGGMRGCAPLDTRRRARRGGLLGGWQALNRGATIDHCIEQLESAGNLDNFRRLGDPRGRTSAATGSPTPTSTRCSRRSAGRPAARATRGWSRWVDETVALMREAQEEDGYLNSWIQGVHPRAALAEPGESHELYCAGHMLQAAVAVARGAGPATTCSTSPAGSPTSSSSASARTAASRVAVFDESWIEQAVRLEVAHGSQHGLLQIRVILFEVGKDIAQGPPDGAGFLRAAAGNHGCSQ